MVDNAESDKIKSGTMIHEFTKYMFFLYFCLSNDISESSVFQKVMMHQIKVFKKEIEGEEEEEEVMLDLLT